MGCETKLSCRKHTTLRPYTCECSNLVVVDSSSLKVSATHLAFCSRGDESSLNLAKQNFERFEVVGILEELDDFWVMMESTFPQYFTGALAKYRADGEWCIRRSE